MSTSAEEDTSLTDYIAMLTRRWWWIVVGILTGTAIALAISNGAESRYEASARVLLTDSAAQDALDPSSQNTGFLSRELSNEISLALSDPVVAAVTDELKVEPKISISADRQSDVLIFQATAGNPIDAADHANAWARVYVETKQTEAQASITSAVEGFRDRLLSLQLERQTIREPLDELIDLIATEARTLTDRRLENEARIAEGLTPRAVPASTVAQDQYQRDFDRLEQDLTPTLSLIDSQISAISNSITQLQLNGELAAGGTARLTQVAAPPSGTSNSPKSRNLVLGGFLGALVGVGLATLIDNLDRSINSVDDIREITKVPVLGAVPIPDRNQRHIEPGLLVREMPTSGVADGYVKIRTALQFTLISSHVRTLLVTSPNQSEGKTSTSTSLAWTMAGIGSKVLLADIDFRRPRLHEMHGIERDPGLSNHIIDGVPIRDLLVVDEASDDPMALLTTGPLPPRPADFLASPAFADTLDALSERADLVILDAPPVLPVADALSVAQRVDATVLTAFAGKTTREQLKAAIQLLEQSGAVIAGIVLVGVKPTNGYGKYGYYSADESRRPVTRFNRRHRSEADKTKVGSISAVSRKSKLDVGLE